MNQTYHRPLRPKPTEYRGRRYPSLLQARRAAELDLLVRAGQVAWWIPEVTIDLGEDDRYRVDFLVAGADGSIHAEDVKAIETREFGRHKRLWRKYGPFPLHVITRQGTEIVEREV